MSTDNAANRNSVSSTTQNPGEVSAELIAEVDNLVNTLSNKLAGLSSELFARMDDMARRMDNLETLIQQNKAEQDSTKWRGDMGEKQ